MRVLHYHIYNKGNVGMCNILMSLENAYILSLLTGRDKIVFYLSSPIAGSNKTIFDFFDFNFPYEVKTYSDFPNTIKKLPFDFHGSLLYHDEFPSKSFINKRENLFNLKEVEDLHEFGTLDEKTLAFYSYLFYMGSKRDYIVEKVKENIKPKEKYLKVAESISKMPGHNFTSIHIRRGDYKSTNHKNKDKNVSDFLDVIKNNVGKNTTLLVHSDETDRSYFNDLKVNFNKVLFAEDLINSVLPMFSKTEQGLVSLLLASYSENFVGTMLSTFTSFIQRYRLYKGKVEEFKFLYPQKDSIRLDSKGRVFR